MTRLRLVAILFGLAAALPLQSNDVLLLYDGPRESSEAFKSARYIQNALDHFTSVSSKELLPASTFRSEALKGKDVVVVVCEEGQPDFPAALIEDLAAFPGRIVWLHMHVDRLLDPHGRRWGLATGIISNVPTWKSATREERFLKKIRASRI